MIRSPRVVLIASQQVLRTISPSVTVRPFNLVHPISTTSSPSINMSRVSDPITQDHRELEEYYNRIVNSKDADEQKRYQNQFVWELARHSVGEELVVYPVMEKSVTDGVAMANRDRTEHQKVKEQLYEFQKMSPSQPEFLPAIRTLWEDLSQHMKEEEEQDLPQLEQALDSDESAALAKSFQRTKKFVPTQSHPSAPDKPPFETVVGLMAAPLDKLMDVFKKFPKD